MEPRACTLASLPASTAQAVTRPARKRLTAPSLRWQALPHRQHTTSCKHLHQAQLLAQVRLRTIDHALPTQYLVVQCVQHQRHTHEVVGWMRYKVIPEIFQTGEYLPSTPDNHRKTRDKETDSSRCSTLLVRHQRLVGLCKCANSLLRGNLKYGQRMKNARHPFEICISIA